MVQVRLESVSKSFGSVVAVDDVSIDINEGEFFFLLGPSGCGKTTILRTVAGFESPEKGSVTFDGSDVTELPPHKRSTGMVFQNYALWPHMSVLDNVAYGLKLRKLSRAEIETRASAALEMVRMSAQRSRFPNQLSGGQQQRVALARALVINPGCLLLDEPLSNLDAKLRLEMRAEIRRIHQETGVTTIYVTHDQKEALSMAERIAVMRDGRIVQTGAPLDLYRSPANPFVAAFVGETNLLEGTVVEVAGSEVSVDTAAGRITGIRAGEAEPAVGALCTVSVRPEDVTISTSPGEHGALEGRLAEYTFLGETGQYVLEVGATRVKVLVIAPTEVLSRAKALYLSAPAERVLVFEGRAPVEGHQ